MNSLRIDCDRRARVSAVIDRDLRRGVDEPTKARLLDLARRIGYDALSNYDIDIRPDCDGARSVLIERRTA